MEYGRTAYNRSVYASPPVGGSGFRVARSIATLIRTAHSRHIFLRPETATQFLYRTQKNVVNSRNVMRNFLHPFAQPRKRGVV
jgi:hypothetical protein